MMHGFSHISLEHVTFQGPNVLILQPCMSQYATFTTCSTNSKFHTLVIFILGCSSVHSQNLKTYLVIQYHLINAYTILYLLWWKLLLFQRKPFLLLLLTVNFTLHEHTAI